MVESQGPGVLRTLGWVSGDLASGLDACGLSDLLGDPGLTRSSASAAPQLYRRQAGRDGLTGGPYGRPHLKSSGPGRAGSPCLSLFLCSCTLTSNPGDMSLFKTHYKGFLSPLLLRLNFSA